MKCDCCTNPATVHLTTIVNGQKKKIHLCSECAEQQQVTQQQELNLSNILQSVIGKNVGPVPDELARLACPICGIKYMEFRAAGRFGCPHDYEIFRDPLEPLLKRIHRHVKHKGKVPHNARRQAAQQAELLELKTQLQSAVEAEKYEEAARLRDLLREKETTHGPGEPDTNQW